MTLLRSLCLTMFMTLAIQPLAPSGHAMTVLAVELPQLVQTSELVLQGKIVDVQNRDRSKDGQGVWTEFTLEIHDVWKGDKVLEVSPARVADPRTGTKRFTWAHPGGLRADGMMVTVPGMPAFTVGEEVVVALEKTARGHVICGGPQGKWSVVTDKSGKKTVVRAMPDVQFLSQNHQTGAVAPGAAPVSATKTLAAFKAEVLAAQKAAPAPAVAPIPVQKIK
jgi:hypothetical protein